MLVAEFMQKPTLLISSDDSIHDTIIKLINRGTSGAFVHKDMVIVGAISEGDLLAQLYPSQQEFMERSYIQDFEEMEANMKKILAKKVKDLMRTNIQNAFVYPSSSIIHVLAVMSTYGFSHLPVVNQKNEIVGEVNQRDIFKNLIGSEAPYASASDYHDWTARFYGLVHAASNRYDVEIKSLIELLKKHKIQTVLDVGFGTGMHSVALAEAGFKVVGIERNRMPYLISQQKRQQLSKEAQSRLEFVHTTNIVDFLKKSAHTYGAVIFMGHILAHYVDDWKEILQTAQTALASPGLLIVQSDNTQRFLQRRDGLLSSSIAPSKLTSQRDYSFTLFYDRPWEDQEHILLTLSILRYDGKHWTKEAINSTKLLDFKEETLKPFFSGKIFKKVDVYGSSGDQMLCTKAFDSTTDECFTYVGYV